VSKKVVAIGVSDNVRRASLAAIVFSPLLVFVSGALRNQQADNLLPAFFSTDHITWFYWDQSRYGSVQSFLAFPIQNIHWNLLFQLNLRAASLIFLVTWIVESCSRVSSINGRTSMQYLVAGVFVVIFLLTFQEAGDSLIYGANAHPIAVPFAMIALSLQIDQDRQKKSIGSWIAMTLWIVAFWGIAIWTSLFTALWAPPLLLLQLSYLSKRTRIFSVKMFVWLNLNIFAVCLCFSMFSRIARDGGENTSFVRGKFFSEALKRSYVSIPLIAFVVIGSIVLALTVLFGRNWANLFSFLATVLFIASVPIIAASTHVQLYSYMPRYFAVEYLSSLLVLAVMLGGYFSFEDTGMLRRFRFVRRKSLLAVLASVFVIGVLVSSTSGIQFGTGKVDASGFINTGYGISPSLEAEILGNTGEQLNFVAGSYWQVWPAVFDLRSRNQPVLAITKKAVHQERFISLYSAKPLSGICVGEPIKCWGSTINAQLGGVQLFSEIDSTVVGHLSDGTSIRKMWVSKYPIRKLER
jgi:hypothetical protein